MPNAAPISTQEIVPGVQAVLGGTCNRGLIESEGNVLVIDAGLNVAEALLLREEAETFLQGGELTLFNTHPHIDHVGGNQVFADTPRIAQLEVHEALLTGFRTNPQFAERIGDITLTLPTITFTERLTTFVGSIEVQFLAYGVAHSPSDSVAWLPQSRTLFAGDLLFNEIVPAMPAGAHSGNWVSALSKLEQLGAEHVIPGHGPIQPPAALGKLKHWIETVREEMVEAHREGMDAETAVTTVTARIQEITPTMKSERLPDVLLLIYHEVAAER